jgi:hypothetical protein
VLVDKGMTYDKIVPLSQDAIKKAKDAEKLAKQQAAASTTTSKSKWAQQKYSGTFGCYCCYCQAAVILSCRHFDSCCCDSL